MIQISGPEWYEHQKVASDCKSVFLSIIEKLHEMNVHVVFVSTPVQSQTVRCVSLCKTIAFMFLCFIWNVCFQTDFPFGYSQSSLIVTKRLSDSLFWNIVLWIPGQSQILASGFLLMVGGGPFKLHEGLMNFNRVCNCGKLRFKTMSAAGRSFCSAVDLLYKKNVDIEDFAEFGVHMF